MTEDKEIIHSIFEEITVNYPENIAATDDTGSIIYRDLNSFANKIAHNLVENGLEKEKVVVIYLDECIKYVASVLGVLKAGGVFLPLSNQFPRKRIEVILEQTKPDIYITDITHESELAEKGYEYFQNSSDGKILIINDDNTVNLKKLSTGEVSLCDGIDTRDNPQISVSPDNGCYIMTTSGSTGEPKSILGNQKGLAHFIHWEIGEFGINQKAIVSLLAPATFDVSLRDIFIPLAAGGRLFIPSAEVRHNPQKLLSWLQDNHITHMHIVPSLFRQLTRVVGESKLGDGALPDLEYVLIAGEPLYGSDVMNWRQAVCREIKLINLYGPSETTLAKLFYRIPVELFTPDEIIPLGIPIPDTEVLIIDDNRVCRTGETGEIYIKTSFMTSGYYNSPALDKISFIANPASSNPDDIVYKTGDRGEYMPDGNIRFRGRLDGQVKLFGNRVETGEIEVILRQHPDVRDAAVTMKPDNFGNPRLIAYIIPEKGNMPVVESLRRFTAEYLPDYMIPSVFVTLESFPLTHTGKIDRGSLPNPDIHRPAMEQAYIPPSSEIEKKLTDIWRRVLNLDRIGVHDNFFDLGGTSLLAIYLVSQVQESFNIDIPVIKLFQYPNVNSLSEYINGDRDEQPSFQRVIDRAQRRKDALSRRKGTTTRSTS